MAVQLGLRLGRWGMLGWSALAFVSTFVRVEAYYAIAGHTGADRAAFGASITAIAPQFTVLLPAPIHPETVAGYVEYGGFLPLAILFAVWAMASAAGAGRGDEEHGVVEAVLATGLSKSRLLGARMAAFAIAILTASTFAALGFVVGVRAGGDAFDAGALAQETLLLAASGLGCYGLCLFVVQLTPARMATASAGVVLLALFVINSLSRTYSSLAALRWLSPFRYLDLSRPLPPGGAFDARAFIVLLGIAAITGTAAAVSFAVRDLGSPLVALPLPMRGPGHDASRNPLWMMPVVRGLYDRRIALVSWSAGLAALALVYVSLTRTIVQPLLSIRSLAPYFSAFVKGDVYPSFIGFTWFNVAQLLFAAFAITQVARWAAEDTDGRLEMILSQPQSRASVVLERMAVLTAGALVIAVVSGETVFYASRANGIELNGPRLAAASLMLVPFALVFAAAGSLLASWSPRAAVGVLGAIAFASYLDAEVGALMKLPMWLQDLSAFKLFGRPLLYGVSWRSLGIMLLVVIVGIGSSILAMDRRDVGS